MTALFSQWGLTVRDWLFGNHSRLLALYSGSVFLLAFGYIVADFVWFDAPNFLTAIIGIIVTRQSLVRVASGISDAVSLWKQKAKIDVLLFPEKIFRVKKQTKAQGFWQLLRPEIRQGWISEVIEKQLGGRQISAIALTT